MTPASSARLTRERVIGAALEIADRDGVDALSMRRVADALGVGTMTLYGYFANKREMLDAIVDAAVDAPIDPRAAADPDAPWRNRLRDLVYTARRVLAEHPGLVQIRLRQPVLRPDALRFAEAALAILTEAGFGRADAARSFRLIFTYVFGFAGLSPDDRTAQARREALAAIAVLEPGDYPSLTAAAAEASEAMAGEESFAFGLERILDGLEARLATPARHPTGDAAPGAGS